MNYETVIQEQIKVLQKLQNRKVLPTIEQRLDIAEQIRRLVETAEQLKLPF